MNEAASPEPIPFDRYRVITPVEQGASLFSAYAYDRQRERNVFIKTPDPNKKNADLRLLREADVLESLDHPQIPHLIDVECGDEFQYIVTEPKPGSSSIADRLKRNGPRPLAVAKLCLSALDVLGYVHDEGFIHRDVKTSNFVMQHRGIVSLVDFELAQPNKGPFGDSPSFGAASVLPRQTANSDITEFGSVVGTANYMAPEQMISGSVEVMPQSDIYGIGSMLHELLSGRLPFINDSDTKIQTKELAARKLEPDESHFWQNNRVIPSALRFIAEKAMRPCISDRYASAAEMAEDLRMYLALARSGRPMVEVDIPAGADTKSLAPDDTPTERYIALPKLAMA